MAEFRRCDKKCFNKNKMVNNIYEFIKVGEKITVGDIVYYLMYIKDTLLRAKRYDLIRDEFEEISEALIFSDIYDNTGTHLLITRRDFKSALYPEIFTLVDRKAENLLQNVLDGIIKIMKRIGGM